MGYANPGDYLDYRVYVPESKYYTINFRVATIRASSQLIIRVGEGNTFTDIDTLTITSTGGWQTWKTQSTIVFLNEGRYTLRLYVRSGEFNTNWFQVASASGVGVNTPEETGLLIYPNPANDYIMVDLSGFSNGTSEILILNALGQTVKTISTSVPSSFRIGTSDLGKGVFYVVVNGENSCRARSKLIVL